MLIGCDICLAKYAFKLSQCTAHKEEETCHQKYQNLLGCESVLESYDALQGQRVLWRHCHVRQRSMCVRECFMVSDIVR